MISSSSSLSSSLTNLPPSIMVSTVDIISLTDFSLTGGSCTYQLLHIQSVVDFEPVGVTLNLETVAFDFEFVAVMMVLVVMIDFYHLVAAMLLLLLLLLIPLLKEVLVVVDHEKRNVLLCLKLLLD